MWDTVTLVIDKNEERGVDFIDRALSVVDPSNFRPVYSGNEMVKVSGNWRGMRVYASRFDFCVSGSLPKYATRGNVTPLSRESVKWALQWLSEDLGLPMDKANVRRLDVSAVLEMQEAVRLYLRKLGRWGRTFFVQLNNGILYTRRDGALEFYDKRREVMRDGGEVWVGDSELVVVSSLPDNMLRYELRYLRRISQQLKINELRGADLYNRTFYGRMINEWERQYNCIDKINQVDLGMKEITGIKELKNVALIHYIESKGGKTAMLGHIDEMRQAKRITKKQAQALREGVNEAFNAQALTAGGDELVQELDTAVKTYAEEARQELNG